MHKTGIFPFGKGCLGKNAHCFSLQVLVWNAGVVYYCVLVSIDSMSTFIVTRAAVGTSVNCQDCMDSFQLSVNH